VGSKERRSAAVIRRAISETGLLSLASTYFKRKHFTAPADKKIRRKSTTRQFLISLADFAAVYRTVWQTGKADRRRLQ